jgi:hypothetical protein
LLSRPILALAGNQADDENGDDTCDRDRQRESRPVSQQARERADLRRQDRPRVPSEELAPRWRDPPEQLLPRLPDVLDARSPRRLHLRHRHDVKRDARKRPASSARLNVGIETDPEPF